MVEGDRDLDVQSDAGASGKDHHPAAGGEEVKPELYGPMVGLGMCVGMMALLLIPLVIFGGDPKKGEPEGIVHRYRQLRWYSLAKRFFVDLWESLPI